MLIIGAELYYGIVPCHHGPRVDGGRRAEEKGQKPDSAVSESRDEQAGLAQEWQSRRTLWTLDKQSLRPHPLTTTRLCFNVVSLHCMCVCVCARHKSPYQRGMEWHWVIPGLVTDLLSDSQWVKGACEANGIWPYARFNGKWAAGRSQCHWMAVV